MLNGLVSRRNNVSYFFFQFAIIHTYLLGIMADNFKWDAVWTAYFMNNIFHGKSVVAQELFTSTIMTSFPRTKNIGPPTYLPNPLCTHNGTVQLYANEDKQHEFMNEQDGINQQLLFA